MRKAVLRMRCQDQRGIVHFVSGLVYKKLGGNIVSLQEMKIAPDETEKGVFFLRLVFEMERDTALKTVQKALLQVERKFNAALTVDDASKKLRLALFATSATHCLMDALAGCYEGDLNAEAVLIIGNHNDEKIMGLAQMFNVPFHWVPFDSKAMGEREKKSAAKRQLALLERHGADLIGLARYMQMIDGSLIRRFPDRIVNIHHSFLPAFKGASPYHQAYKRGVKNIGATAHFITEDLDEGPIIDQDTERVEGEASVDDFIQTGRAIEKRVFLRALKKYAEFKTVVYKNKVIVFK